MSNNTSSPKKLAVLGGGVSATAAVYQITSEPGWQDKWDITIYQLGWRTGGKGASGRNPEHQDRIEEHGLHVWFGFYDNAFRVMRDCYEKLGRPPGAPLATLEDAFKGQDLEILQEQVGDKWVPWPLNFPPNDEKPGTSNLLLKPWDYLKMLLEEIASFANRSPFLKAVHEVPATGLKGLAERLHQRIDEVTALPAAASALLALEVANKFHSTPTPEELNGDNENKVKLIPLLLGKLVTQIEHRLKFDEEHLSTELRRIRILLNLSIAVVRGLIRDYHLLHAGGWHALDDQDLRSWLASNGADEETLDAPVTNLLAFSTFSHGRPVAAGAYLYSMLRGFFTYKGSVIYKMQAGMGDAVFGPFYEVLRQRGVRFEFFQRVAALRLSADKKSVDGIDMFRQVRLKGGEAAEYLPLVDVKGLPCWPSAPVWEQIENAEQYAGIDLESYEGNPHEIPRPLKRGVDFDEIVFGISAAALPVICQELINDEANPRFKAMVESVDTAHSAGLQLWLKPTLEELGWTQGSALMETYAPMFNASIDMTDLLPRESWQNMPPENTPRCLTYFSGEFAGDDDIDKVIDNPQVMAWLTRFIGPLWPDATTPENPDGLNWDLLVDPQGGTGVERLKAQFLSHIPNPSDRYVRCSPTSAMGRISTDESGYDNLYLTGDWTLNPMNLASVEASTMAGLRTANALLKRDLNFGIVH
ncbi:MAG TPA: NAD(P)-binding protein [Pyrinomonadaceae bacterium]|jgi:uncharacterized protein with NAD-binding domain and iron-sulfur cluster|nr:NAD(P)-binding protein [Pyrinomonadaceae bacterium]